MSIGFNRIIDLISNNSKDCIEYPVKRNDGYGVVYIDNKHRLAHRVSFFIANGILPKEIDHLCKNHSCINPLHLESVSHYENMMRGNGVASKYKKRTHCKYGHLFSKENTTIFRGSRRCKTCKRNYYHKKLLSGVVC